MTESELQNAVRMAVGRETDLVIWRNSGGVAEIGGRKQRFGLCVGASDLIGIFRGRFVAWEIKTPRGRVTPEQERFLALVSRRGGFSAVIRSVDDAHAELARMRSATE